MKGKGNKESNLTKVIYLMKTVHRLILSYDSCANPNINLTANKNKVLESSKEIMFSKNKNNTFNICMSTQIFHNSLFSIFMK